MRLAPQIHFPAACSLLLVALLLSACSAPTETFEWQPADTPGRLMLFEGDQPVLGFNHGPQLASQAPENRAREGYIFPLYTPSGVSPLDDFPRDHWHHRGLFWAWPVIEYDGLTYDIWTLGPGITLKHHQHRTGTNNGTATLEADQGWYVGDKQIVSETVELRVQPAAINARSLEIAVTLEALDQPVVLGGSPDRGKGYGGMNVRFAPRTDTRITTPEGEIPEDEDMVPHAWTALEANYEGKPAGVRVESLEGNPGNPQGWCLRPYGFIGANFPGTASHTLKPGSPLTLRYRVTVYDGTGNKP
jgi:hypothetical protein